MKKVFFALILGLAGVNSAQGDDGRERYVEECLSVIGRPTVMVTSSYGKLKYNFDKDGAYLRRETERKYQESGQQMPQDLVPVGLTKVRDGFDFNMTVGHIEISHGYSCLYPQEINAHLGYYVPTIYILKDLQKGTCLYEVALRHEKTHMQIYIEALDYFLPEFKKAAVGQFDRIGVRVVGPGESADDAARELNEAYLNDMKEKVEHWRREVEQEQMKFDTPQNYILESKLCEGKDKLASE